MNLFSKDAQIDRARFWVYIVLLWGAKAAWAIFNAQVVRLPLAGPIDTCIVILMAVVVAARFRDIGWRVWIGPTLVILLMLVLPAAVALGVALTVERSELPSADDLFGLIGLFTSPEMAALVIVAGSTRSKPALVEPHAVTPG